MTESNEELFTMPLVCPFPPFSTDLFIWLQTYFLTSANDSEVEELPLPWLYYMNYCRFHSVDDDFSVSHLAGGPGTVLDPGLRLTCIAYADGVSV